MGGPCARERFDAQDVFEPIKTRNISNIQLVMADGTTFAFEDFSEYVESTAQSTKRTSTAIRPPKLLGWRLTPFKRPHLNNQVIRRDARRAAYWWSSYPCYELQTSEEEQRRHAREVREKADAFRHEFELHANKWKSDTEFLSSVQQTVLHPSYQRIIGMGPDVLPFILRDLEKKPAHWFWALHAITGAEPVPEEDRGRIKRMVQHWLNWAKAEEIV